MMDIPASLGWYMVAVAILITAHEWGHYRVARACGIRIYQFSVGFGPVLWRRPFGDPGCEFMIRAIPLGGFVLMLEKPDEATPPQDVPRALANRPLWQRAAVILAGPLANLVLGVVFYAAAQFVGIRELVPAFSQPAPGSMLAVAGAQSGYRVLAVTEDPLDAEADAAPRWRDIHSPEDFAESIAVALMDQKPLSVRIRPLGQQATREFMLPLDTLHKNELDIEAALKIGLTQPYAPPVINDVVADGAAAKAGVQAGDLVERIDDDVIVDQLALYTRVRGSVVGGQGRAMVWHVRRGGQLLALTVTPHVVTDDGHAIARADIKLGGPYASELVHLGPIDSTVYGVQQTWRGAALSLRMFGRMITGKASVKNLNGPLTIGDVVSKAAKQGLAEFLVKLAQVSVGIGVLNLLPIPVLDGGRLLYYLFEGATGRPVSTPWQTWLRYGGVFAILLLMSLALSNDLARFLGR